MGTKQGDLCNTKEKLFFVGPSIVPSIRIFIRSTVHAFLLSELCSRDVMTVKKTYTRGSKRELNSNLCIPPL